jgi:hypothetical protein
MSYTNAFLEMTKGFSIPVGSVIVIFSASHLAWAGAATYAKDWVSTRMKINRALGGGVELLHGLPAYRLALVTGVSSGPLLIWNCGMTLFL